MADIIDACGSLGVDVQSIRCIPSRGRGVPLLSMIKNWKDASDFLYGIGFRRGSGTLTNQQVTFPSGRSCSLEYLLHKLLDWQPRNFTSRKTAIFEWAALVMSTKDWDPQRIPTHEGK